MVGTTKKLWENIKLQDSVTSYFNYTLLIRITQYHTELKDST